MNRKKPSLSLQYALLYIKFWFDVAKYPALVLGALALVLHYGQGIWVEVVKIALPILVSGAVIWLIASELWRNKARLGFIGKIYFRSGFLAYVRAFLILITTISLAFLIGFYAPSFLQWGWANLVLGYSTNLAFQPFVTLSEAGTAAPQNSFLPIPEINYGHILIFLFWILLILTVPFLAEIEERIFRQGIHTWKGITASSLKFGLVHLIMGIPIYMGLTLFVPGFLFACRYKYAYHRHLQKFNDELQAQEAGVHASTADHAIYNAMLITCLTAVMLFGDALGSGTK